jgi:integrase
MTTEARRGEPCALRRSHVNLPTGTTTFRRGVAQDGSLRWEKDTKTHQQRRVTIDPETEPDADPSRVRTTARGPRAPETRR